MTVPVKKCSCGRVSNPVFLEIVKDTWIKGPYVYVMFDCPQCLKEHTLKMLLPKE